MKIWTWSSGLFYYLIISLLMVCCKKDDVPTLITIDVSNITRSTAISGGTIVSSGGTGIYMEGICWSSEEIPVYDNKNKIFSTDIKSDSFTDTIAGLLAGTQYYIRAFAWNSTGIGYGNTLTFTTLFDPVIVPVTTNVSNIMQTTANCGGSITSDYSDGVTARGVCWSASQNPSISDNKTVDGITNYLGIIIGGDCYVSKLSGLSNNTTYFVRAYVTNKTGTGYGNVLSFTTLPSTVPGLITDNITNITPYSATGGGAISLEGVNNAKEKGVCWSTIQNPTIIDSKTSDGNGPGSFVSILTGLNPDTKYFARSYATFSEGTAYGSEVAFRTYGIMNDIDGNEYNTVLIGAQTWMKENLRVTKLSDGTTIPDGSSMSFSNWNSLTSHAYCWYYYNDITYRIKYGALYNWYSVKTEKLCPSGWHVPSKTDWTALIDYLGGASIADDKLKETGTGFSDPKTTNESGFSAHPSGARDVYPLTSVSNGLGGAGFMCAWWSSSEFNESSSWIWKIYLQDGFFSGGSKSYGYSVRCIKDN